MLHENSQLVQLKIRYLNCGVLPAPNDLPQTPVNYAAVILKQKNRKFAKAACNTIVQIFRGNPGLYFCVIFHFNCSMMLMVRNVLSYL